MKYFLSLSVLLIHYFTSTAQPYIEGGNTRHRFAQLELGLDIRHFSSQGTQSYRAETSGLLPFSLKPRTEGRIVIGGTHFWGHADFFVAFPVASIGKSRFGTLVETGARYFPWRIENKKILPFAGVSWQPASYKQGEGSLQIRHQFPISAGLVYNRGAHLFELSAGYLYNNEQQYYLNTNTAVSVKMPSLLVSIGYKYLLETTLGAERGWKNGRTALLTDSLGKEGKLNGFTIAAGPSSAIFLKPSSHNTEDFPYLGQHKLSSIFPEFGIGYYWHRPDIQLNLAYRRIYSRLVAYGHTQEMIRKALSLESYKFIADYHGFAPFIGPAISREWLSVYEELPDKSKRSVHENEIRFGLTFGWDIRPDRLQRWYLRTNLRWFPGLNVDMGKGRHVSFDQLEFNFIQLVIFPERMF